MSRYTIYSLFYAVGILAYYATLEINRNFGDDVFASLIFTVILLLFFGMTDEEPNIGKQIIKKSPFKKSSSVFLSKYFSIFCSISLFVHFMIALFLSPFVDMLILLVSIIVGGILSKIFGRITINSWNIIYQDGMKKKDLIAELNIFSFFFLLCLPVAIAVGIFGSIKYLITSLYVDKKSISDAQGFDKN